MSKNCKENKACGVNEMKSVLCFGTDYKLLLCVTSDEDSEHWPQVANLVYYSVGRRELVLHYVLYMEGGTRDKEISPKRTPSTIKNKNKQTNFTTEIKNTFGNAGIVV